jgi:hypothetical protein
MHFKFPPPTELPPPHTQLTDWIVVSLKMLVDLD